MNNTSKYLEDGVPIVISILFSSLVVAGTIALGWIMIICILAPVVIVIAILGLSIFVGFLKEKINARINT